MTIYFGLAREKKESHLIFTITLQKPLSRLSDYLWQVSGKIKTSLFGYCSQHKQKWETQYMLFMGQVYSVHYTTPISHREQGLPKPSQTVEPESQKA